MNGNPDWMMPTMGKQENSPYDMLIDLVPWYVVPRLFLQFTTLGLLFLLPQNRQCFFFHPWCLSMLMSFSRPQVRQLLYQHPQEFSVSHFISQIGIKWPHADDLCHYWDIEAGYSRMTPLFESTIIELANWTIDPKILKIMPQLEGNIPTRPFS